MQMLVLALNAAFMAIPAYLVMFLGLTDLLSTGQSGPCTTCPPWTLRMLPLELGVLVTVASRMYYGKSPFPMALLKLPLVYAIGAYSLMALIMMFVGKDHGFGVNELHRRLWLGLVPIYIFSCGARKPSDLVWALYAYVLASIPLNWQAIDALVSSHFTHYIYLQKDGYNGPAPHHVEYGDAIAAAAVICFSLLLTRKDLTGKLASAAGLLYFLLGLAATICRAAIFGTGVAILAMALLAKVKMRYMIPVLLAGCAALAIGLQFMPESLKEERLTTIESASTVTARVDEVEAQFKYLRAHPFQPIGLGQPLYNDSNEPYFDYTLIIVQDYLQMSIVGFIALLAVALLTITTAIRNSSLIPVNSSASTINIAAFGIIIVFFIHANMDSFWNQVFDKQITFAAMGMIIFVWMWIDAQITRSEAALAMDQGKPGPATET